MSNPDKCWCGKPMTTSLSFQSCDDHLPETKVWLDALLAIDKTMKRMRACIEKVYVQPKERPHLKVVK